MHHWLRKVTALVFSGSVTIAFALPGCTNRLGPVRATQNAGETGRPNLPDRLVEHAKVCVEFDGHQLEPGRVDLEATIPVNEDGDKLAVTLAGISETAPDFGACMRNALRDMPIAAQPFQEAVAILKYRREHAKDGEVALHHFIEAIPGVPMVDGEVVLEVEGYTVALRVKTKVVADLEKLVGIDEAALKKLGQMALDSLGYDEIMKRAKQVGWVKTVRKIQPKAPARNGLIAQSETEVVVVMFEVFTEHAVTAGIVSQVDSPLPGPADLAAIGILAVGLYKAGAVAIGALITATAPAPTSPPPPPPPPPSNRDRWQCTASCNVQQINQKMVCPDRVTGSAGGPNEPAACVEAKRSATQSTPVGCYPRHCQCRCSRR